MADFSFSFDSDNPFAEPETAPKKATASADDTVPGTSDSATNAEGAAPTAPATEAPVPTAPASGNAEFSLDSFDFAFGEDDSINDTLPTRNIPLDEAPPRKLTPGEAAFAEFDFSASDKAESPNFQTPAAEVSEAEVSEVEVSEVEVSEVEVSEIEPEPFVAEAPVAEAPEIEPFVAEAPEVEPSVVEAPVAETPAAEVSEVEVSEVEVSEVEVSEVEIPEIEALEAEVSEAEAPVAETPEFDAFEIDALEFDAFEVEAPEVAAPEVEAPEVEAPEFDAFEVEAPEAELLEVEAPEAESLEIEALEEISEVSAPEVAASTTEVAEEAEASAKSPTRNTRSDLEEFNAFTYDFGLPDDETSENAIAGSAIAAVAEDEISVGEESSVESLAEGSHAAPAAEMAAPAVAAVADQESAGQTEGEYRRLKTKATLKVAVLGASGIGKNHARWFHRHGCQIVAFLGTSPETTTQTETDLSADFDFQGNAYTDLETLLQTEKPDIVCVATPPPLHFGHVLQSLEAGAHVLCEKPLVYAPTRKFRENRDGAKELVKVAARRNLNLGTQLQYGGATPILCKLAGLTPADVGDFAMEIETVNRNSPSDPRELWIDLGPHPVSVAQMLAGAGAQLAEETIVFEPYQDDEKTEVLARFGLNCADGRLLMVRAVVRALRGENPRKPRRRFSFNGHAITYAPLQSSKNGFQAQFVGPDGYASVYPDPVDYLIGNFVNACRNEQAPMISGDFGRENLEWMLKIGTPGETR